MMLDFLDAVFVDRWQASLGSPIPVTLPVATIAAPAADDFVGRLLAAARTEWEALADEVVAARGRGRRAVAIVACERAAGCSTLVAGLVRVLHERRRDAIACASDAIPTTGATHDKRIVLVDAGVWFPPGRINRQRLMVASSGCDAAILVVRSGRRPPIAWSTCLEAIGVEPLGEVASFVPSTAESQR